MTRVASLVLMTHVDDQRFRTLGLDLEGRDQRVFGVDLDAVGVSFEPKSDGEMHAAVYGATAKLPAGEKLLNPGVVQSTWNFHSLRVDEARLMLK